MNQTRFPRRAAAVPAALPALLPGAMIVGFAFASGGFLPGPVAFGATALALLLAVGCVLGLRPRGRPSTGYIAAAALLALLACWTLLSATWSGAPARAVTEYDRVLLYLLGFVVVGALGRTPERLRWMLRAIAAAAFAVCLCGLITRLAPDVWPIRPSLADARLSYPMGYWNALGLLAAIGGVIALALTSDERETPLGRSLAAAALPVLGATLLLTFSRGAIAAGILGLVAMVVAGRPRLLACGLLVAGPTVYLAIASAYDAELLASADPTTSAAIAQGHHVARVVGACMLAAALGRVALLALDGRLARFELPARIARPAVRRGAGAAVVAAALVAALAAGAPAVLSRHYDRFVEGDDLSGTVDQRSRLSDAGNNGRIFYWRVALHALERRPLRGTGAGTFALEWDRHRPVVTQIEDGHSLYAEILGELGIVGFVLVVGAILLVLGGFLARARGPDRVVGGALFAAGLTWALHAGIDWDWEMPAITLWLFAAGGLALAGTFDGSSRAPAPAIGRVTVALACLLLAFVPERVFVSERGLRASAREFAAGDCVSAVDSALRSSAALRWRPEPYIVLGYCDVRLGRADLATRAMRSAVRYDPDNWEGHYGLALALAAAGRDPRPSLRVAHRLSPREPLVGETAKRLGDDARTWRAQALRVELPTE